MCSNYRPDARLITWLSMNLPAEVWPLWRAPFVRRADSAGFARETLAGHFGLLPHWAREASLGRHMFNARSETAHEKPSFRDAWRRGRRCIIPAEVFYEPCWETGKAVRHGIRRCDGEVMGIAGLWDWNPRLRLDASGRPADGDARIAQDEANPRETSDDDASQGSMDEAKAAQDRPSDPDGTLSFTMLTVNADGHAVLGRMHKPADEKRIVVILPDEAWDDWLEAPIDSTRDFLKAYPADELEAIPSPLPPRKTRPLSTMSSSRCIVRVT